MTPYDKIKIARKADRPTGKNYVEAMFEKRIDLCGDRRFADDSAIVGGVGYLDGKPVTYIAINKGTDINERIKNNFGCPKPEGYRKALRLIKQAEKFKRPVVCFVDTLGAFCGADAEERGQGEAIAENLFELFGVKTPIISIVIGEGGSGGALALAVADRVYMLEHSIYSVITPEGCASILWKDSKRVADATECLHLTADDMQRFGVSERIINENFEDFALMCSDIKKTIEADFKYLSAISDKQLLDERYEKFRKIGIYCENGNVVGLAR